MFWNKLPQQETIEAVKVQLFAVACEEIEKDQVVEDEELERRIFDQDGIIFKAHGTVRVF